MNKAYKDQTYIGSSWIPAVVFLRYPLQNLQDQQQWLQLCGKICVCMCVCISGFIITRHLWKCPKRQVLLFVQRLTWRASDTKSLTQISHKGGAASLRLVCKHVQKHVHECKDHLIVHDGCVRGAVPLA